MSQPSDTDIELGQYSPSGCSSAGWMTSCMLRLKAVLSAWKWYSGDVLDSKGCETQALQVEDYRNGYPRFSALIAAHDSFHLCRRFSNLRARLLLHEQDKLSILEEKLEKIDLNETSVVFLGNSRRDANQERKDVLLDIDAALAKYDSLVERNHRMLSFEAAKPRAVLSLQNWVNSNACLARKEIAYLKRGHDLLGVVSTDDSAVARLEAWVEDTLIRFYKGFHKSYCHDISRDSNVYIVSGSLITQVARTLISSLIIVLLLVPVVICNAINSVMPRMMVIIIVTILFIATLSGLTKARTVEMFVAGAAYTTVLTVFVSGATSGSKDLTGIRDGT